MVVTRKLHEQIGEYSENYKIASDLDFINRILKVSPNIKFIEQIAAECTPDGLSSGTDHLHESRKIAIINGKNKFMAWCFFLVLKFIHTFK